MAFIGPPVLPPANERISPDLEPYRQNVGGGAADGAPGTSVQRDVFPYCFNIDEALCGFLQGVPLIGSAGEAGCRAIANAICLLLGIVVLVGLLIIAFNALAGT